MAQCDDGHVVCKTCVETAAKPIINGSKQVREMKRPFCQAHHLLSHFRSFEHLEGRNKQNRFLLQGEIECPIDDCDHIVPLGRCRACCLECWLQRRAVGGSV